MIQTIFKSIVVTILTSLILACAFTLIGLLLNFWNESVINASIALIGSLLIGGISTAGLNVLIEDKLLAKN